MRYLLVVDVYQALDDPVRRSLLRALRGGPRRVVDLAAAHPVSRPAVSRHLRHLAEAGLVEVADRGRERHYELRRAGLEPLADLLAELRSVPAPLGEQHLDALETEVRRTTRERRRRAPSPTREETA